MISLSFQNYFLIFKLINNFFILKDFIVNLRKIFIDLQ